MRSHRTGVTWLALMALVVALGGAATAQEKQWWPFPVEDRDPPFNMEGKKIKNQYTPLAHAAKKWNICVSFPHMKDAYWTAVDYGVVAESRRLGVKMQLVEAGGYTNLPKQISQIEDCVSQGANAVVIGAISETGLNKLIEEIRAKGTPVIDVINGISSPQLSAKSLVSFGEMGAKAGEYLVKMHPKGAKPVKVAWFPGPPGAGWVVAGNKGFVEAASKGAIEIVTTKYGDTGKEVQLKLVEDVLQAYPDIDYIVGTSPTTEASVQALRDAGKADKVKVLAYYFTPGVYQDIKRGAVLAAPTDSAVIQGRIAIDQAVRILEHKPYTKHTGPAIYVIDKANINSFHYESSLAPPDFKPTFSVD
ncbi:MAG: TMAO reductase system periplasmic protein TorT [Candidatus Rokuibacteriota bacterium]|nr:MAG: TMAO reductase system periplasmic protein TorT [Candidatus Rokubacteria bacterium]